METYDETMEYTRQAKRVLLQLEEPGSFILQ